MGLILTASAIVQLIDWKSLLRRLSDDAAKQGAKQLLKHLKADDREKAARQAIKLFIEEWLLELEDKTPLSAAIPGYKDQLKRLIESAGPEIVQWMDPENKEVDLGPVQRVWSGMKLDSLPENFSWDLVAQNYGRAIRKYLKSNAELRAMLSAANEERIVKAIEQAAGPEAGFDLQGYREFLKKKCSTMQLAVMHSSAYQYDRKITLWSVFVPQLARGSAPILEIPPDVELRLREQGHLVHKRDESKIAELRQRHQTSAVSPVLEIVERERLVVVLGNPGSGKSSLLKYLALRWAHKNQGRLPLLIDLREYVNDRGIPEYFESSCTAFRLDAREVDKQLKEGKAVLLLDGLDEIFDNSSRGSMVDEVIALASRYPQAQIILTSRSFGYEPEKLQNNGFNHATIEDFNDAQVGEFLRQWHEIAEDDAKEQRRLQGRIERALGDSRAIRELAGNPLLLTMMAILNRNQELPRDRVELYREASRVLLGEWDASRALPVDAFARQEKEALLRALAGDMQQSQGGLAGNLIDRSSLIQRFRLFLADLGIQDSFQKALLLVQQLTERNFILAYVGADHFSFVHRTFLEYYCAAWFVDRYEKKQTLTLQELKEDIFGQHWSDERWHEVLRLIAGMVEETKAEELILYLMQMDGRKEKLANLMLAAGCLSEVRNRKSIEKTSEVLWERFVQEAVRYDPPYYYAQWEENTEAGPTRRAAVERIVTAWSGQKVQKWLRSTARNDLDPIVREAAVRELVRGWKEDPEIVPLLKDLARSDKSWSVRKAAVQELARGWKEDPETLQWLKDRARSDEDADVRGVAVQELARGWKEDPETLALLRDRARSDEHWGARLTAVYELARGWKEELETLPLLKDRARSDKDEAVRLVAVQELVGGWKEDPETLALLKDLARSDEDADVRGAAVLELARGWKEEPEILSLLKDRARCDKNKNVRQAAVEELARGWGISV